MIKLNYWVFGSAILLGSMVLTGCGTSEHPVAIAPRHHSQAVSPSTSASASPLPSPTTPSSSPVTASSSPTPSPSALSSLSTTSSPVPSRSSSTTSNAENAILYTNQQKSSIIQAAHSIGLPAVDVPMHGFGSQLQYTQRILMSGGGSLLVIQYNNFSVQEFIRPMLIGRAVLRTVPLTILGSSVTGTWNQPASASGGAPPLTFHRHGMYYLIGGSRALSQTQIDTIAESLTKL